jgi:hypothetical protein
MRKNRISIHEQLDWINYQLIQLFFMTFTLKCFVKTIELQKTGILMFGHYHYLNFRRKVYL